MFQPHTPTYRIPARRERAAAIRLWALMWFAGAVLIAASVIALLFAGDAMSALLSR